MHPAIQTPVKECCGTCTCHPAPSRGPTFHANRPPNRTDGGQPVDYGLFSAPNRREFNKEFQANILLIPSILPRHILPTFSPYGVWIPVTIKLPNPPFPLHPRDRPVIARYRSFFAHHALPPLPILPQTKPTSAPRHFFVPKPKRRLPDDSPVPTPDIEPGRGSALLHPLPSLPMRR